MLRYRTKDGRKEHFGKLLLFLFLLTVGVCTGGFAATFQNNQNSLSGAFVLLDSTDIAFGRVFLSTLFGHLCSYLLYCVAGCFWFLFPVFISILFMKGYFLGFSIMLLYQIKGILAAPAMLFGVLLPHGIILLCYLSAGILSGTWRKELGAVEQQERVRHFVLTNFLFLAGVFLQAAIQPAVFKIFM